MDHRVVRDQLSRSLGAASRRLFGDSRFRTEVTVVINADPRTVSLLPDTLRSLEAQTVRPAGILVVAPEAGFPDRIVLQNLLRQGVDIVWSPEDDGVFNRVMIPRHRDANATIATACAGVRYPRHWFEALMHEHRNHPSAVVGYSGLEGVLRNDDGVVYPCHLFPDVVFDGRRARAAAGDDDDLWFWAAAQRFNVPSLPMKDAPNGFPRLPGARPVAPDVRPYHVRDLFTLSRGASNSM